MQTNVNTCQKRSGRNHPHFQMPANAKHANECVYFLRKDSNYSKNNLEALLENIIIGSPICLANRFVNLEKRRVPENLTIRLIKNRGSVK